MSNLLAWATLLATAGVLALLVPFALHRTHLLFLARRAGRGGVEGWEGALPLVTVQLPVYNEAGVVERLVDAAAALDYPRDRLEIQLLDDSTDSTSQRAAGRVRYWREAGVTIEHIRRDDRSGFKAGALAGGMERARGEFILILDADFVPRPDLIHRLLGPFRSAEVGMVQARWDHLNEGAGLLTRCQALLLDGHFFFEQGGRCAAGRFMNFNGTAGMWRRSALEDSGGWSADTLTEDLDLSYRAQLSGWRFVFLPEVGVPAELPEDVRALEVQQRRWSQGGVQTGRKVLPELLRGDWPLAVKAEGMVHLLGHVAYPLTMLLGVLLLPSALARRSLGLEEWLVLDLAVVAAATGSFLLFYLSAGRARRRPWTSLIPTAFATLALGIGLTAPVSRAVLRGFRKGPRDPFVRTPKRGDGSVRYRVSGDRVDLVLKLGLTAWMLFSIGVALRLGLYGSLPFMVLFALGYGWLGFGELRERLDIGSISTPAGMPAPTLS